MTEIKILFTKKKVNHVPVNELSSNSKGLRVEVETDFHMFSLCPNLGLLHPPVADAPFAEIAFIFENNAESETYNNLLVSKNKSFEITFDKDKVWLNIYGFANVIDKTKPEVRMIAGPKQLSFFFETKFQGIIKLSVQERDEDNQERERDNPNNTIPNSVKKYFQKNKVECLTLEGEDWVIDYQNGETETITANTPELQAAKSYLQSTNKSSISRSELNINDNNQNQSPNSPNYLRWALGIGGILVGILIALLFINLFGRKNRN